MPQSPHYLSLFRPLSLVFAVALTTFSASAATSILVSVPDQKLYLVRDGERVAQYKVSTSRFGLGDKPRTYSTPLGKLQVADRVGAGAPVGAVFKGRHRTGEILKPNARGRDPIVTRILHLRGLEAQNSNAYSRGIYIHGTPVERTIGRPDSYGCIRMRSKDVIALFDSTPVGTPVEIVATGAKKVLPRVLIASLPQTAPTSEAPLRMSTSVRAVSQKSAPAVPAPKLLAAAGGSRVIETGDPKSHKMRFASVRELSSLGGAGSLRNSD